MTPCLAHIPVIETANLILRAPSARLDPDADRPGDKPCHVYRHPAPGAQP
ncbi:MAG: hypothetical protein LJE68_04580 [Rhodobacter sp.]|jgi:hypothetical protein|nr:hypothetical protein [Rhodobacter sp.]